VAVAWGYGLRFPLLASSERGGAPPSPPPAWLRCIRGTLIGNHDAIEAGKGVCAFVPRCVGAGYWGGIGEEARGAKLPVLALLITQREA